jgi:hypothetical protein
MPLIPLAGSALKEIPSPERVTISKNTIAKIADGVLDRLGAIKGQLLGGAPWPLKLAGGMLCGFPARAFTRGKIAGALSKRLFTGRRRLGACQCRHNTDLVVIENHLDRGRKRMRDIDL